MVLHVYTFDDLTGLVFSREKSSDDLTGLCSLARWWWRGVTGFCSLEMVPGVSLVACGSYCWWLQHVPPVSPLWAGCVCLTLVTLQVPKVPTTVSVVCLW